MRPFRLLLSLTCCVLAVTFLLYLSVADPSDSSTGEYDSSKRSGLSALFSFHGPLFPPSAVISLTDDNSTFFLARPANFGPLLPGRGLSGQLWIGSGFANDAYGHGYPQATAEGELGCSDVPGWDDDSDFTMRRKAKSVTSFIHRSGRKHSNLGAKAEREEAQRWEDSRTDAEGRFFKESAQVAGRVVLLSRGGCGFLDKVKWAQRRGGVAVIVGDNVRSGPIITMYARGDTSNITIPALFTSRTTAHLLSTLVPTGGILRLPSKSDHKYTTSTSRVGYSGAKTYQPPEAASAGLINRLANAERSGLDQLSSLFGFGHRTVSVNAGQRKSSPAGSRRLNTGTLPVKQTRSPKYSDFSAFAASTHKHKFEAAHHGLWVTLTPTNVSSNPFLDTLLVLVVSPLVTLTVVYALLLLRSRMQRRRWRAPKSVVERLPVRTYHTLPASSSSLATPAASSPTTPLLQTSHRTASSGHSTGSAASEPVNTESSRPAEPEKQYHGLAEWRRRYGGRQRECVVCLEEYEDGISRVMSLPCGHEFHAECITPWLTTRRRTCPICKGDVVRSLARSQRGESPTRPDRRRRLGAQPANAQHSDDDEESASEDERSDEEDVQTEAAITRNDSPSAARPIPVNRNASELYEEDLEGGGAAGALEERARTRAGLWSRFGSLSGLGGWFQQDRGGEALDRDR